MFESEMIEEEKFNEKNQGLTNNIEEELLIALEFDSYLRENFDDVIEWTSVEIEEAINLGDIAEDHAIAIEIFENGNEWVLCYSDADNILYTQKNFENSDSLSIDKNESTIYFKPTSQLNADEKKLVVG
jgi:hypothetical protein